MRNLLISLIVCLAIVACKKSEPANYTSALPDDAAALVALDLSSTKSLTGDRKGSTKQLKDIITALDKDQKAYAFLMPNAMAGILLAVKDADCLLNNESLDFTEKDGMYWAETLLGTLCLHEGRLLMMTNLNGGDTHATLTELMSKDTYPKEMLEKVNARKGYVVAYGDGYRLTEMLRSINPQYLFLLPVDISTHNIYFTINAESNDCTIQTNITDGNEKDMMKLAETIDQMLPMYIMLSGNIATIENRCVTFDICKLAALAADEQQQELFQNIQSMKFDYDDKGNFTLHITAKSAIDKVMEILKF